MEIDRITFPLVIGIDWDATSQMIKVYAQVSTLSSQSMGGAQTEKTFKVIQGEGETLLKAMVELTDHAQQNISWKHVVAVILSNKLAEHGIGDVLDYLNRFYEIHVNSYLLITKDNLEELLGTTPKLQSGLASPIIALTLISEQNVQSLVTTVKDYTVEYLSREIEPVIPLISIYKLESTQKSNEIEFDYKGVGVFKKDKLAGWLDEFETRGLNFIFGTKNNGSIVLNESGKNSNTEMTVHDISTKTEIIPKLQNGNLTFTIKIKGDFDLGESSSPNIMNSEDVPKEEKEVDSYMKKNLEAVIEKAQKELKADIFGFGGKLYRKYPSYWLKNKVNWDEIFSKAKVNIEVDVKQNDTDELSNSLKSQLKKEGNE